MSGMVLKGEQQQSRATLMQPPQYDLQAANCKKQ
jgi:hypothetical protein